MANDKQAKWKKRQVEDVICECRHEYTDHELGRNLKTGGHLFSHTGKCTKCECAGFKERAA